MNKSTSNGKNYTINDRIGVERMPLDDVVRPGSFTDGTGIRKYAKGDKSVERMRKDRAKAYAKRGIGIGLAAYHPSEKQIASEAIEKFKTGKKNTLTVINIQNEQDLRILILELIDIELENNSISIGQAQTLRSKKSRYSLIIKSEDEKSFSIILKRLGEPKIIRNRKLHVVKVKKARGAQKRSRLHKSSKNMNAHNTIKGFEKIKRLF